MSTTKTLSLLLSVIFFMTGCVSAPQKKGRYRKTLAPMARVMAEPEVLVGESMKVSLLGFNQRDWQPAGMQDFQWPIKWLRGEKLSDQIYVVKQVGASFLFCLVRPVSVSVSAKKSETEFSLFLVQPVTEDPVGPTKILSLDGLETKQIRLSEEAYWTAPTIVVELEEHRFQFTRIYRGVSRSYAERLMNKFPWRALAQR
jgi:hypothetical protein